MNIEDWFNKKIQQTESNPEKLKNINLSIGSGNREGILLTSSSHGFRFESIKMSNPKSLKQL